jgi:hypothetical protein
MQRLIDRCAMLEDTFEVLLVNAAYLKHVPGRKTDVIDAQWIAEVSKPSASHAQTQWVAVQVLVRELWALSRHRSATRGRALCTAAQGQPAPQVRQGGANAAGLGVDRGDRHISGRARCGQPWREIHPDGVTAVGGC